MKKPSLEREIAVKNNLLIYAFLIIIGILSGLVLYLWKGIPSWCILIFSSLVSATVAGLAVTLVVDLITKKDIERHNIQMISEVLIPKECPHDEMPGIYGTYSQVSLEKVLKNTIKAYTGNDLLSDSYLSFIKGSYREIKINEKYDVVVSGNNTDGKNHIKQSFQTTLIFQPRKEKFFKAFIVFKQNKPNDYVTKQLDEILNDNSYFFREMIEDADFSALLKKYCLSSQYTKIIQALNLKISLFDERRNEIPVPENAITVTPKTISKTNEIIGIDFQVSSGDDSYVFPDSSFSDNANYYKEEKYIRSTFKIMIDYPIPDNSNNFYLVYSRPTIAPHFTITFKDLSNFDIKNVYTMSFLSYYKKDDARWDGKIEPKEDQFVLDTDGLIFPRSGVAFSWDFREKLSLLEQGMVDNNLVDVQKVNKDIEVNLVYSTPYNFTGQDLYGGMKKAYLLPELAVMLKKAQEKLSAKFPGYKLLVLDGARPVSVQEHMFKWAQNKYPDPEKYVANPKEHSWHNYGAAVDVTIVNHKGKTLDMGTKFDSFEPKAHIDKEDELVSKGELTPEQKKNRDLLRGIMTEVGFETFPTEWWHFQKFDKQELEDNYTLLDFYKKV